MDSQTFGRLLNDIAVQKMARDRRLGIVNERASDCPFYHIDDLADRSARNIVRTDLIADAYHYNIWTAARVLCQRGYEQWWYRTQYSNGTTLWSLDNDNGIDRHTLSITSTGAISMCWALVGEIVP